MKKYILIFFVACIAQFGLTQAPPKGINYQAVVYSDNGENEPGLNVPGQVLRNKNIRVRFTIIQNTANGTEVYKEAHTKTTDAFGMFSLVIGQGVQEGSNAFTNINWGAGIHFLKVEIDKRGGTNYVTMSNQQLLSVPYALYSDKSTYATSAGNGIASVSDNGNGSLTFTYTDGSTYTTPILTGLQGPQGIQGATGAQGPAGQNGTNGTNGQNGLSAYEIWLSQGNTGTEQDFLTAITGAQGIQGVAGQNGQDGANGANGQNGLSAYEIWLAQGNAGTEQDFLTAITGSQGATGAQGQAGQNGTNGTNGQNGLSAYEIWLAQGNTGTEQDFLTAITGAQGIQGIQGVAGANGTNGTNGTNGVDGKNTLAKTTTESAGTNCTTGGVKIEYGLDANNNGTLDVSEINATMTKYLCNGETTLYNAGNGISINASTITNTMIPKFISNVSLLNITGVGSSNYSTINLSSYIPAGSTHAILYVSCYSQEYYKLDFRKNSTSIGLYEPNHLATAPNDPIKAIQLIVPLDAAQSFQYLFNKSAGNTNGTLIVNLVGYY